MALDRSKVADQSISYPARAREFIGLFRQEIAIRLEKGRAYVASEGKDDAEAHALIAQLEHEDELLSYGEEALLGPDAYLRDGRAVILVALNGVPF